MEGEGAAVWQGAVLGGILFWIVSASYLDVTRKLRSFFQPWVSHHVETQTSVVLKIQVTLKFHPNCLRFKHSFFIRSKLWAFLTFWCTSWIFLSGVQSYGFGFLDALFSGLSCVVSVPFYTGFLPLLFWVRTTCYVGDVRHLRICLWRIIFCLCRVDMANWRGRWRCWWRFVIILVIA